MTDRPVSVEELYALPAAEVPPRTPREEITDAAKILHQRDGWATNTLMWWLLDTAQIHAPDEDGHCERDGDRWPCLDITRAQRVAETVRIIGPTPLGDIL